MSPPSGAHCLLLVALESIETLCAAHVARAPVSALKMLLHAFRWLHLHPHGPQAPAPSCLSLHLPFSPGTWQHVENAEAEWLARAQQLTCTRNAELSPLPLRAASDDPPSPLCPCLPPVGPSSLSPAPSSLHSH